MANVLTVVAKIRAAKGKGDALAALLKEQVAAVMKAEPGCLVYRPHRSTKDPALFVFYEQYKDDAAFDVHRKAPHLASYRERRGKEGLTEGPPEGEVYRSLNEVGACALAALPSSTGGRAAANPFPAAAPPKRKDASLRVSGSDPSRHIRGGTCHGKEARGKGRRHHRW